MKKDKNEVIIILMAIIIIILSIICILFATDKIKFNNLTTTNNEISKEDATTDYSRFLGIWKNTETYNEINITNISDTLITFNCFFYRLTSFENLTIPFNNGKGIFYFYGYQDKNFDGENTSNEKFIRSFNSRVELAEERISDFE